MLTDLEEPEIDFLLSLDLDEEGKRRMTSMLLSVEGEEDLLELRRSLGVVMRASQGMDKLRKSDYEYIREFTDDNSKPFNEEEWEVRRAPREDGAFNSGFRV